MSPSFIAAAFDVGALLWSLTIWLAKLRTSEFLFIISSAWLISNLSLALAFMTNCFGVGVGIWATADIAAIDTNAAAALVDHLPLAQR